MEFLIAAISLGFLGSFHCIGMCGPIALALPVHNEPPLMKHLLILSYNLGRIITYSLLGLVAGVIGQSIVLAGLQRGLSITIGLVLLATVFLSFKNNAYGNYLFLWIRTSFAKIFSKGNKSSLLIVGLLNGFLPCGLVYVGLAGAVATGSVLKGSLFMAAFGAGTLPMMILLPLFGTSVSLGTRKKIQKAMPVMISVVAVLLILRGLDLGIPYISPKISEGSLSMSCHAVRTNAYPHKIIKCNRPGSH